MYIERIEIEGGFLTGLKLDLQPGLNVLIGARGTGKTSIIELVRFALAAPAFTERARVQANQHAVSVLGSGRITLNLRDGDRLITVSRTAADAAPIQTSVFRPITVLAQNEMEAVGAAPEGRLRLVDMFLSRDDLIMDIESIQTELSSQTAEIQGLIAELGLLEEQLFELAEVPDSLAAALTEQQELFESVQSSQGEQELLQRLQQRSAELTVGLDFLVRTQRAFVASVSRLRSSQPMLPTVEQWPRAAGGQDRLAEVRQLTASAATALNAAMMNLQHGIEKLQLLEQETGRERVENEEQIRPIRTKLEQLRAGAGALAQRVAGLKEKEGQVSALAQTITSGRQRLNALIQTRSSTYDSLEALRETRFSHRKRVATTLNNELKPKIRVSLTASGMIQPYSLAIAECLQGSGLHYNALAPQIAARMSPLEFVEAIETQDAANIAASTGINLDRATSICSFLARADLTGLVMSRVDDAVSLSLLDGQEVKDSTEVSIGQRCTVVLPILLSRHRDVLVVDQPEDHLDNAFITDTLVPSLNSRHQDEQLLFSSHNANIPVLGEADLVVLMESNGRRGFVRHAGRLDDPETVDAVTDVMEGGKEAFRRRADFYERVYGLTRD